MPEPDFEQIARAIAKVHANRTDEDGDGNIVALSADEDDLTTDIAEQLRMVWNARGAADIAKVQTEAGGTIWQAVLPRALRKLDR
jgi:hypothetical protein